LGKAQGTGSIVNDDNVPPPTLQFNNTGVSPSAAERAAVIALFAGAADTANVAARVSAVLDVTQHSGFVQAETNRAFVLMRAG
jgi:hypothetical protein